MAEQSEEKIKQLLSRIVKDSMGIINIITFAWRDGIPVATIAPSQVEAEFMTVASAAALGSLDALGDVMGSKLKRIDVEFENGEHVIISVLNGSFIAVSTTPNPNLGLIHLIVRKYEKELKRISGIGHVNPKEVSKDTG